MANGRISAIIHIPCAIYPLCAQGNRRKDDLKGQSVGSVESQLLYPTAVHCSWPNNGNTGTPILYHLRNRRRPHSSSGTTTDRQGLLGMGTAAASAGAAGPSEGLRAGWSSLSGRTEAGVHRGERTTHLRERNSEPDDLLRPTRHGPGDY